ncbi:MAG: ABC transporter substrate-binding protein [Rhodospirillaceae bacterium]|nr:ABC transporter substrate-binding protein [Rhodospirillaceae bacterium]
MISRRHFAGLSLAIGIVGGRPAGAQEWRNSPNQLIEQFAQLGIKDILGVAISRREKTDRFRVLFKDFFDIPSIGRFVLGRFARAASAEDNQKFSTLFEDVIVYTWSRRFAEYKGQTLKVKDSTPDGEDGAVVNSDILGNDGQSFAVSWRLRKRETGFRVVDVIIEGVSMAITYRQEYATVIQQSGGMAGLLDQMQKQVDDLKAKVG